MKNKKPNRAKVLIAAGGTGGHLFPAQALAKELKQHKEEIEVLFAGAGLSNNRYFHRDKFLFEEVASSTFFQKNKMKAFNAVWEISRGIKKSFEILKKFQPDLVVGFGSFHSFPILTAAVCKKIPIVLFESNSIPGKVNRLFSKWAVLSATQFFGAREYLSGNSVEVNMPLWGIDDHREISVEEARKYFDLDPKATTFLVFGGSQGASAINKMFCEGAALLAANQKKFQVIHLTGNVKNTETVRHSYALLGIPAVVKDFEEKMAFAWRAATLAICRAGAVTLAELIAFEVPAILIPYPYASEDHQNKNAKFVEHEIGAAVKLLESEITSQRFLKVIEELFDPEHNKLLKMQMAIQQFKMRSAKKKFSSLVYEILKHSYKR